jgi:aminoglycoside phosphotransferase (APT) family kinase protein
LKSTDERDLAEVLALSDQMGAQAAGVHLPVARSSRWMARRLRRRSVSGLSPAIIEAARAIDGRLHRMLRELAEPEIVTILEQQIGGSAWRVDLIAASSNYVYRCENGSTTVAVRTPRVDMESPSAYWRQMRQVFGLSFPPLPEQLASIAATISQAGSASPRLLAATNVDGRRPVFITTWLAGTAWEADEFPPSGPAHRTLGQFLARMHANPYAGFGTADQPLRLPELYYSTAVESARAIVETAWTSDRDRLLSVMAACDPDRVARTFALVMPDISGNQFLFDESGLAGVVDTDSYVIGPVELELTIAEWCLADHEAFADGYRSVRSLPTFAEFRTFHRVTMLINEEAVAGDIDRLLGENVYFD